MDQYKDHAGVQERASQALDGFANDGTAIQIRLPPPPLFSGLRPHAGTILN